jgi:outer membrane protein assembly factor BamB
MNEQLSLERQIAGWMADEATAVPASDAVLADILATTSRVRPRPSWWAVLAEPPMRSRRARIAVGLPNRGLVLAAIVALILAALLGVAVGANLLIPHPPPATIDDWPGFRGDATRQAAGLTGPIGHPVEAWRFHATGGVLEVALVGDRAYFATDDGQLFAVTRDHGVRVWSVHAGEPPLTGPYAADGRLYLSDANGTFHALAQSDGAVVWTSPAAYSGPSRAISVDGTLYFGTADGFVVALDAATGAERWRLQPPGATGVDAPAFGSGLLFAGTHGGGYVAIDPSTRRIAWTGDTHGEITGTATVADGIAYIGVGTDATSGTLHAFEAKSGRPLWSAEDPLLSFPTVSDGVAYTTATSGLLAAVDTASGRTKWKVPIPGDTRSPVVAGGVVYLTAGASRRVHAVEAATGNELWHVDLDGYANCCVSVAGGVLYVGTLAGSVYAISGDGAGVAAAPFPSSPPSPSATQTASPTPRPTLLPISMTASTDLTGRGFAPACQIAIDPQGGIWAPAAATDRIAIFSPDGKLLEEWGEHGTGPGQFDFTRGNGDGYGTLAFAKNGSFYVLDVGNRRVQQFEAGRNWVRSWGRFGDGPRQYNDPVGIAVAPDDTVWVLDDRRDVLEHYDPDGNVIGSFDPFASEPVNEGANSLAVDGDGNLYVSIFNPSEVLVLDPTGSLVRVVGKGQFTEQAGHMAIDRDGRLFVTQGPQRGDAGGVLAFDANGTFLGGFGPEGGAAGELEFTGGIALDGKGSVFVEDSLPETARLLRFKLAPPLVD